MLGLLQGLDSHRLGPSKRGDWYRFVVLSDIGARDVEGISEATHVLIRKSDVESQYCYSGVKYNPAIEIECFLRCIFSKIQSLPFRETIVGIAIHWS